MYREVKLKKIVIMLSLIIIILPMLLLGCSQRGHERGKSKREKLELLFPGSPQSGKSRLEMINSFEKSHPDIDVKVIWQPWSQYASKLMTMIAGGNSPDVGLLAGTIVRQWIARDVFMGLDLFIKKDPSFGTLLKEIYPQNLFESVTYNGKLYALPIWQNPALLYYNKSMFDKEGLSYPNDSWTWADYVSAAKKLTKSVNGHVTQYGTVLMPLWVSLFVIPWQEGLSLLTDNGKRSIVDDPRMVKAFKRYYSLWYDYKVVPTVQAQEFTGQTAIELFTTGKVGMVVDGHFAIRQFSKVNFSWGVAPARFGKKRVNLNNSIYGFILKGGKNHNEAWKFLKYMLAKKSQNALSLTADVPVVKKYQNSEIYLNAFASPKINQAFIDALQYAKTWPAYLTEEVFSAMARNIDLAVVGNISFEDACKKAARDANKILGGVK